MKEFYEAFNIKKVRACELRDECFLGFAHPCGKCDIYGQAYEVYPPITSDIVLGLINIIINNDKFILDGFNMAKNEQGNYFSTNFKRFCDQKKYYVEKKCFNTFNEALFDFCIFYKDAIQDQVRALFND